MRSVTSRLLGEPDDDPDNRYAQRLNCMFPDVIGHSDEGSLKANMLAGYKIGSDSLSDIAREHNWEASEHDVGVSICIYHFGELSLKDSSFHCDFGVKLVWKEGTFEDEPLTDLMNACSAIDIIQKRPNWNKEGLVNSFTRQQCKLLTLYNCRWFPFDAQAVSIRLRLLDAKANMIPLKYYEMKEFCKQPDWYVSAPCRVYTKDSTGKPLLIYSIIVRRKWEAHWVNIILMQCSVTTLSFTSFCLPVDSWSDRGSVALSLILTTVAFKLFVAGEMPKVSYLSVADIYMLASYLMQILIVVVQFLPMLFCSHLWSWMLDDPLDEQLHEHLDRLSCLVLLIAWFLFNLIWHVAVALHICNCRASIGERRVYD